MADAPPIRVLHGVEYAAVPGYRPLLMDLYLPAAGPAPLVLYAHGGGWRAGSRESFGPAYAGRPVSPFAELAAAGVAVASVDYRLSGEARYPAQLTDVTAALDRLRADAGTYGIDADRVAVWGESAGGHLAALLALTVDGVAAAVDWYAPVDFARLAMDSAASGIAAIDPAAPDSREALLLGAPPADVPDAAARASPVTYAHAGAPPFLIAHGTSDRLVPYAQSQRLAEALTGHGVPVELVPYDGADHMWREMPEVARAAFIRSRDFVLDRLAVRR